jgi:hypothetical protein
MSDEARSTVDDLRGASRLAVEATKGVMDLVQAMHRTIGSGPAVLGRPLKAPVTAITHVVYGGMKGATHAVGAGLDLALAQLAPVLGEAAPGPQRELVQAALNGVLGDYLAATGNPLAWPLTLRHADRALPADSPRALSEALASAGAQPQAHVLLLVHGSCMNDRQWRRNGHDHGALLAEALGATPVYARYNSGLHVSENGAELAARLDALIEAWPVPVAQITALCHSMGGLVMRSAAHVAEQRGLRWRSALRAIAFLGTPHHGAPLERGGNWVDVLLEVSPYSAPLARLGQIRSAGVTDLRHGAVIEAHWRGRDRFAMGEDRRAPLPLPRDVACFAVAGRIRDGAAADFAGDGLVPVHSALGAHPHRPELSLDFQASRCLTVPGVHHLGLLDDPTVARALVAWLSPGAPTG